MKMKELRELVEKYPDYDLEFIFTDYRADENCYTGDRYFEETRVYDVKHEDRVVAITGNEYGG